MTAQDSFTNELASLIDSYNGLMSYSEIIGILEVIKFDLYSELVEAENNE